MFFHSKRAFARPVSALAALLAFVAIALPGGTQIPVQKDGETVYVSPQTYADIIQGEVAEIRGLPFKRGITAQNQSLDDFEVYLDKELAKQVPDEKAKYFGKIVQTVGLHRGPEIDDMLGMTKSVMKSQAAAYYDPETSAFYVLMSDMPEFMLGGIYAHELYHGLQDQHFDLDDYLMKPMREGANDDEVMARQAVVEGEATLVMTLWTMQHMFGELPSPEMLEMAIAAQANMNADMMRRMVRDDSVMAMIGPSEGLDRAVAALDDIPAFMIETLVGAYMKGMAFVYQVQKQGWDEVARLFVHPPASTEQILHPEKWLAGEMPTSIAYGDFEEAETLEGWRSIDSNTLGEIQLGIILDEHELESISDSAAAGWDGDRYAVLLHEETDEWALMLTTTWDTEEDAAEFADAYSQLIPVKYPALDRNTIISLEGREVLIAEGPEGIDLNGWLEFMRTAEKEKMPAPELLPYGGPAAMGADSAGV